MITESCLPVRKRTLRKVHVQFLRRKQEDEDYEVDPDTKMLSGEASVFRLGSSLVLVEENRKLRVGPEYLNSGFKISDWVVRGDPLNKIVTLNLQAGAPEVYVPWSYASKRLRSYGDLDLATWADRIDNFYKIFDKVVGDFDRKLQESSLSTEDFWDEYHIAAQKACHQIERKFDKFCKFDYFLSKEVIAIIASSFSEALYKELGYTDESFSSHIEKLGLPGIFEGDSVVYFNCVKHLLALAGFMGNLVYQFPEERPYVLFHDGSKRKARAHAFHVFEPTAKGFISHYYYVVTKIDKNCDELDSDSEFPQIYSKCHKGTQALTNS